MDVVAWLWIANFTCPHLLCYILQNYGYAPLLNRQQSVVYVLFCLLEIDILAE